MDYSVSESAKAKHVRLKVSLLDGSLTVVIPRGFDRRRIPEVLAERRAWVERTRRRVAEQRGRADSEEAGSAPTVIKLRAFDEEWRVEYRTSKPPSGAPSDDGRKTLVMYGEIEDEAARKHALRRWVDGQARAKLVPWLISLSKQHGLPVNRVIVRSQCSRWASCSERKTISINRKLVFLPATLVEQVLVHELCHTVHLNHSRRFWALLQRLAPLCALRERELSQAWSYVPAWMDE